jgi:hypothetical protein
MSNSKVNHISFRSGMSAEYYFHGGILIISDAVSEERGLEIIKSHLRGAF